jgi:uncharacterized protein (TIGR02677 family)
MAPARHLQINQETLDRRDQSGERSRMSWIEAEPLWLSPRLHVSGRLTVRGQAAAVVDQSRAKLELARLEADEAEQMARAQRELASGRPMRLSEFGVLEPQTFHLLLDLLGEALANRTDTLKPLEVTSMDGSLLIRLGPAEETGRLAEIVTSFGVLRGPDCEVTISNALEASKEEFLEELVSMEA